MTTTSQVQALHRVLEHARRTTPHYSSLPPVRQVSAAPDALLEVEPLSRGDLQLHNRRLTSLEGSTDSWRVVRTTGTTGEPVEVVVSTSAQEVEAAIFAAHMDRSTHDQGWRDHDVVHVACHPSASSVSGPSPWGDEAQLTKWNLSRLTVLVPERAAEALCHLTGRTVTTTPSVARVLLEMVRRGDHPTRCAPRAIVLSGEGVGPHNREEIATLGPVTSLYTMAEVGILATACDTSDGYHVAQQAVWLEVLDEDDLPAAPGVTGEVVVTPLANSAMPLLRYRTGDLATWASEDCGCSQAEPVFTLSSARRSERASANPVPVELAKGLATAGLRRVRVVEPRPRRVAVEYEAAAPLDPSAQGAVTSLVRGHVAPDVQVVVRRVPTGALASATPGRPPDLGLRDRSSASVAKWLRSKLSATPGLVSAMLTGSSLAPEWTTRFSDIDLVVILEPDADVETWAEQARLLRRHLPALRTNIDVADELASRAPLLVCRLMAERLHITGRELEGLVGRPGRVALAHAAIHWAQDASATLWSHLTDEATSRRVPLFDAWLAMRTGLDGLRYRQLLDGFVSTRPSDVLATGQNDPTVSHLIDDVHEAADVAREHRPPPAVSSVRTDRYLLTAIEIARSLLIDDRLGGVRS